MKKEELLQFVPDVNETGDSTHKIAEKAKVNSVLVYAMLVELKNLPMPLIESFEFKQKKRVYRYWKRVKPNTELIEKYLSIQPENRSSKEHDYLIKFKYYGDTHKYFLELLNG